MDVNFPFSGLLSIPSHRIKYFGKENKLHRSRKELGIHEGAHIWKGWGEVFEIIPYKLNNLNDGDIKNKLLRHLTLKYRSDICLRNAERFFLSCDIVYIGMLGTEFVA